MADFKKNNNGLEKTMNNNTKNGLKNTDQHKKENNKQTSQNGSKQEESRYFSHKDTQSSMKKTEPKKCNGGCNCTDCNNCKPCK